MKKIDLMPSLEVITKARGVVDDLRKLVNPEPVKRLKGKKVEFADETPMDDVEEDLCDTPRLLGITTRNAIIQVRKSLTDQWKEVAWVEYASTMSRSMSRICEVPDLEYSHHDITTIKQYILATVEIEEQLTELIREFKND